MRPRTDFDRRVIYIKLVEIGINTWRCFYAHRCGPGIIPVSISKIMAIYDGKDLYTPEVIN